MRIYQVQVRHGPRVIEDLRVVASDYLEAGKIAWQEIKNNSVGLVVMDTGQTTDDKTAKIVDRKKT